MFVGLFSKFTVQLKIKEPLGRPGGVRCARTSQGLIQGHSSVQAAQPGVFQQPKSVRPQIMFSESNVMLAPSQVGQPLTFSSLTN